MISLKCRSIPSCPTVPSIFICHQYVFNPAARPISGLSGAGCKLKESQIQQEQQKETKKVEEGVISLYRGPLIAAFIRPILRDSLWHVTLTSRTN